jgi:glycosyltransferase involved in cell wall biosynthesis/SAM-dependent methyltransferase
MEHQAKYIEDRNCWILNHCKIGDSIIDIGSQDGHTFNKTPFEKYVTSVDLDKYDIPNFYQMDAHNLQFSDKFFDTAILAEILEHVEDPIQVLKEANRVAKRILITVPNEYEWDKELFPFRTIEESGKEKNMTIEEMAREGNPNAVEFHTEDGYKHLWHIRYYTEETLRKDLEDAGITDYKLEKLQYSGWSFFTIDTNPKVIIDMMRVTGTTGQTINIQASSPDIQIEIPKHPIITFGSEISFSKLIPEKGKLRIALVSTPFFGVPPQKYGGLEQVVWDLAESLDELGHIITVFAPGGSKIPKHGSLVVTGPALDTVNVNWFKEEENRYFKWKDIITHDLFDIVHDHSWFAFPYYHRMSNLKLRVIHTHHGGYIWNTAPPFPKPNLVSISKFMKQYTEQYFKQKGFNIQSEYVYNGVDLDRYNFDSSIEKTDNLLYVGRFSAFKDPLMAMRIALKANLHIDLIGGTFVEDPNYLSQLELMCQGKDISIHKDVGHEFKIRKMQEAKTILIPSKMNEPFGLVAIEAMACGCPVICLRDGALPEIVIDGVTGFVCDNEEQMIEAVSKVDTINSEDCRKRAEQFSKKLMAENYVKLYQKMMNGQDW